jgi:hypothetical protein
MADIKTKAGNYSSPATEDTGITQKKLKRPISKCRK